MSNNSLFVILCWKNLISSQASIKGQACWLDAECLMKEKFGGIKSKADMTEEEKEALTDFVKKSLVVLDLPTELFRNESQTNGIVLK